MKPRVLIGSKQEIADTVLHVAGNVREAIIFIEDPQELAGQPLAEDIFAEMESLSSRAGDADYSREALYSRTDGE